MSLLTLKSEEQIIADMISVFKAQTGISDFNPGSLVLTLLEAAAAEDFEQYVHMLDIIRNFNLDTTTGQDLDNRGFEYGLTRNPALNATGSINILRQAGFTKVSTTLYSGQPSPIQGNTVLYVNDASNPLFGTSGSLIIGRGTANEEVVTYTAAPIDFTNYWQFTISPLANNHGLAETVILSQGTDVTIVAGTVVRVPAAGTSPEIDFTLAQDAILLAGEAEVDNVNVTCTQPGSIGNIPVNAINGTQAFISPPFSGAQAVNVAAFTTGQDLESDDAFRDRIKNQIQSLSKGVETAILNGIIGLVDATTAKRVVSASIILPTTLDEIVQIFIDDGTGFEPSFDFQGFEVLIAQAQGGEQRLQLQQFPLVKAQLETNTPEPYNMSSGTLPLTYQVGTVTETIDFQTSDFAFPASATAQEVVAAINRKALLIQARTANGATQVVIEAVADTNEDLQILGGSANGQLNFPTDSRSTLYLYKNNKLLSKDGSTAFVDAGTPETYNFSGLGAGPWPLNIVVDGKTANPQVVNFVSGDFANAAAGTAEEVVAAINARLAGATAVAILTNTSVRIVSNTLLSAASAIHVTGGSANGLLNFPTSQVNGTNNDYVLNRFLGQIELNQPLNPNDTITAASLFTRAFFTAQTQESYSLTSGQTLIITIDGGSPQTITFPTTGVFTAAQAAAFINSQLVGGTASVRMIGTSNFLELTTNTQSQSLGSIFIDPSSTATAFNFQTGVTNNNERPHRAFSLSSNAGPYTLPLNQTLIIILDNSPATETFLVTMTFNGTVTSATSATQFSASALNTIFSSDGDLVNYWLVAKTGVNSTTGTVASVTNPTGNTYRYIFSVLPTNLANFAAGDNFEVSGMQNVENNGDFIITAVNTSGTGYIEVTNISGVIETGSSGAAILGERRQISANVGSSGAITLGSGFTSTPGIGDTFGVIPYTTENVVSFLNNIFITPLSTQGIVEAAVQGTKIQISSQLNGSNGYVEVSGGTANPVFGFSTSLIRGLQGYEFYTGLLKLVHKTIYGDDSDPVSFPGIGAAGIQFDIEAPTVTEVSFSITLTLAQGFSISTVSDLVTSAVTSYVNGLGVGQNVILSEIVGAIVQVTGVTDVQITTPTSNVLVHENELPRTRNSLITLG